MMNTIEEVDAALIKLPASPTADADIEKRAALVWRRHELLKTEADMASAAKARERLREPSPIVIGVPFDLSHVWTADGQMRPVERDANGRRIVKLNSWADFKVLLRSNNGLYWERENNEVGGALERMTKGEC